jgi:SAM-dependent methyltransferase
VSKQAALWAGDVGTQYAAGAVLSLPDVDAHWLPMLGQSRVEIDRRTLASVPRNASVLEVGCGVGNMLECLRADGFADLHGCDINKTALQECVMRGLHASLRQCEAARMPYADGSFDLVYTSALLIHVAPEELAAVQREIARVSRRWVYGYEYYAPTATSRASTLGGLRPEGVPDFTHKAPFANLYLLNVPGLRIARQERIHHTDGSGNADEAFLLEKGN